MFLLIIHAKSAGLNQNSFLFIYLANVKNILPILLMFFSLNLSAQENLHAISGIVQDKLSGQPVEFATIQLLKRSDSSIVSTSVTKTKFQLF
jgi:hypothetical protein